jgi:hypothetical protein
MDKRKESEMLAEKVIGMFEGKPMSDADRKEGEKAMMDAKIEKIRRDTEKLQKANKDEPNDSAYETREKRIAANHDRVARLKDTFAKKWGNK